MDLHDVLKNRFHVRVHDADWKYLSNEAVVRTLDHDQLVQLVLLLAAESRTQVERLNGRKFEHAEDRSELGKLRRIITALHAKQLRYQKLWQSERAMRMRTTKPTNRMDA